MARNSRFRTTSGPSSGRPRPDKKRSSDSSREGGKGFGRKRREGGDTRESKPEGSFRGGQSFGEKRPRRGEAPGGPGKRRDDQHGGGGFRKGGDAPKGRPWSEKRTQGEDSGGFRKRRDTGYPPKDRFERGGKERTGEGFQGRRDDRRDSGPRGKKPFSKEGFKRRQPDAGSGEQKPYPARKFADERGGDRFKGGEKRKSFVESKLDRQRKTVEDPGKRNAPAETNPDALIRLNKYISNSGICSRREADDLIKMGLITVNGQSITEMGYKVKATDDVRYEGKRLKAEPMVYILLNKPKGYITTTDDPQERNTVMQLIEGACKQRVYPVGRLDRNTSGLLLVTNDGDLTDKLTHPSYNVKKIYKAELDKPLTKADFQKIKDGVRLEEGKAIVDDLAVVSDDGKTIGVEIHIGWNRVIRRIFEALGYEVVKLDRTVYATLDKKDLPRGHWRFLRQDEVIRLKHFQ